MRSGDFSSTVRHSSHKLIPSEDELIIAYVSPSGSEFHYELLVATDTTQAKLGHVEQLTFTDSILGATDINQDWRHHRLQHR